MASEEGSPTDLLKEPSPPPPASILEPSAEAGSPTREPRELPVICTSDGTPAAADPDEAVPDKPLQMSEEPGTPADQPGSTAESGACTTDALGTVEKTLDPVKPSEATISEGYLPEGTNHASGDLTSPSPIQSLGRSIKEAMAFGPSEWDVRHLNPFHIHPGAQIRSFRRSGNKVSI
jgi:hypothetical protein